MTDAGLDRRRRRLITAGVMTGMFLAALEATVIGTAMPTVVASLGGMEHYSWVFSAYLLTSTVTVPLWGRLSDLLGRRMLYQISIAIFLVGSVLSGLAQTMPQLIAFRAIQGTGAGGLVPLGMTIIGDTYTLQERAKMQAFFSGVWGLASVIGPLIGGFLTDQLSWRWVFYINVPVGVAAALIIGLALQKTVLHSRPQIDYLGAALFTASVTLLMVALVDEKIAEGHFALQTIAFLVVAVFLAIAFVWQERRAAEPIIPFRLFRNRVVTVSVVTGFLSGVAMFSAISFIPLFAQGVRGTTATEAGSLLTPLMLSWVVTSIIGGRLMLRLGYRSMVLFGLVLLALSFFVFATFDVSTPYLFLVADLIAMGAGLGFVMLTLLIAVQQTVAKEDMGISTSLNQFARSIGGAVGVALMGALLTAGLATAMKELSARDANVTVNAIVNAESSQLDPRSVAHLRRKLGESLHTVFNAGGVLTLLAFGIAWTLPKGKLQSAQGEDLVLAEMTTIDAPNEPDTERR
jgi:EmrB/QacA subfamily drug resistance transporter